jgi:hypothetical protein
MDLWRCSVAQTPQNGRINKDNSDIGSSQLPSTRVVVAILSLVCSIV